MTKSINLLGVRVNELQINTATLSKSKDINLQPNMLSPRNIEQKNLPSSINGRVVQKIESK